MPFNATEPGIAQRFFPDAPEDKPDWLDSSAENLRFEVEIVEMDKDPVVVCSIGCNEDGGGISRWPDPTDGGGEEGGGPGGGVDEGMVGG